MAGLPGLSDGTPVAVAVSGGPDSMALALLAQRWASDRNIRLVALTVDHGLRPGSGDEARQVAGWMAARGIAHRILPWQDGPRGNLQASARQARYRLMEQWCAAEAVPGLLLAHHLEDQAETVLLRLGRGSGVYGLAAMPVCGEPSWPGAPRRLRPLLDIPRERLAATLLEAGQPWVEDPSNADPRFARVRIRRLWSALAPLGITPSRLSATARHMARAAHALDAEADALIDRAGGFARGGYALLDLASFRAAHDEVALRALARVLRAVGGRAYVPRFDRLERLRDALFADRLGGGATLAGCRLAPSGGNRVLVAREPRGMEGPLGLDHRPRLWDGRFVVRGAGLTVDRLRGQIGAVRRAVPESAFSAVPSIARPVLPALYDGEGLLAVPALGYVRPGSQVHDSAVEFAPAGWERG
jgi:tRNA(Ile)-lysidine synthase